MKNEMCNKFENNSSVYWLTGSDDIQTEFIAGARFELNVTSKKMLLLLMSMNETVSQFIFVGRRVFEMKCKTSVR